MRFALLLALCGACLPGRAFAAEPPDWPSWRGADGTAISRDARVPLQWGPSENIIWRASVPGRGHSSPIVWQDQVFVTTADERSQRQMLICFDRQDGQPSWQTVIHQGSFPRSHRKNSHASATPACDGEHVYCVFVNHDGLHVTAVDLRGRIEWQVRVGDFESEHGYGSSPVLYGSFIIVNGDNLRDSFIAAVDCKSGELVWRTQRKTTGRHGSYATPTVTQIEGRDQLVLMGISSTASYDPQSGTLIWFCQGPAEVTAGTVAVYDDLVIASGGYPEKEILAIRATGQGDVSHSHVVWRARRGVTYVPSPLADDGLLYVIADDGIATCFDVVSGRARWQERLSGKFSASPTLAGDHLFVPDESGATHVLRAGARFELVATNDLGEGGFASPVICGDRLFLRTNRSLYCIGDPEAE